jgi:hypothetical protein
MKESIVSALKFTDSLFSLAETIELVIRLAKFRLWHVLNFPDIRIWPAAGEANFWRFFLTTEKRRLPYTPTLPIPHSKENQEKGLPPSEIKVRDERLAGAPDFIHPLGKKQLPGFPGKPGALYFGKFRTGSQDHETSSAQMVR